MKNLNLFITVSLLFITSYLNAATISEKQAIIVSNNFITERYNDVDRIIDNIYLDGIENINFFYVVELSPVGFLLISANSHTIPIIAFSFYNNFEQENLPLQLESILNSFRENIYDVIINNYESSENIQELWTKYLYDDISNREIREVSPLITANWNQGGQWNDMCPGNAVVGCVAVAMAQVMYYWGNPIQGNGYTAYYHAEYGPISINFEEYNYDFDNMEDNYATESSQLLLYHSGVAVHMDYSPWGSGASVCWEGPSSQDALKNHFNYIDNTACDTKINYDDNGWFGLLVEQLDNGWPVIYRAYGENDGPGHAWNVDGYQEGGYLHCNWGWGGSSNGYFYFNNLNGGGYNFVESQAALINIFPQGIAEPIALFDYEVDEFVVTFNNLSIEINENQIVSYLWDFGNGEVSNQISPTYNFVDFGLYDVSLIITDEYGQDSPPHIEQINLLDLTGDINNDFSVDVVDIVSLVNLILFSENDFNSDADLNEDGFLSVIDVILLVNIVLDN